MVVSKMRLGARRARFWRGLGAFRAGLGGILGALGGLLGALGRSGGAFGRFWDDFRSDLGGSGAGLGRILESIFACFRALLSIFRHVRVYIARFPITGEIWENLAHFGESLGKLGKAGESRRKLEKAGES